MKFLLVLALAFVALALSQTGTFGLTGQQAVTATAAVLAIPTGLASVCVKALPSNTSPAVVWYGGNAAVTTSTGWPLSANDSVCVPVGGGQRIFLVASGTGSGVAWLGTIQ